MKEALDIIESLRDKGFIVHYSKFSDDHLKKMIAFDSEEYREGCNWVIEAIVRNDSGRSDTKYNKIDCLGRSAFSADSESLLIAALDVKKQIDDDK